MSTLDPLASAHDALWALFLRGPAVFAAQFFIDPQTASANASPEKESPPVIETPAAPALHFDETVIADEVIELDDESRWSLHDFRYGDETCRFKLYIPACYTGQPLPMIVMLHGAGQDADDFALGTEMNAAAEAQGYIVVYPDQSESTNLMKCWHWFRPGDQTCESGETAMLAALTREVVATYHVDAARVYVAGLSAGGAMAVNLAVTHPELYAAAAIHSGIAFGVANDELSALCAMNDGMGKLRLPVLSGDEDRARAVPMIVFHGDADDTVHPRNGEQIITMTGLLRDTADVTHEPSSNRVESTDTEYAYTRKVYRDEAGTLTGEQWTVHGLGHAWSGGHPEGTYTDRRGPHATSEILRFFGQCDLNDAA